METTKPHQLRILVVDDDPDTAQSTVTILRLRGFRAWAAFRTSTAMIEAKLHKPNVVLMDIGLRGTDGYELARELCCILPFKPLLVAISGFCQSQDRRRAAEKGFDHFFAKSVDPDELLKLLERTQNLQASLA